MYEKVIYTKDINILGLMCITYDLASS